MKNLKKLLCGALSLTMVLGLAACGGNTATTDSTDGDTAAKADGNVPVIGISQYGQHASLDNCREGFLQGLQEAGLVEGTDYTIDYQNASFDDNMAIQIAQSFSAENAALMVGIATPSATACYAAAEDKDIPVIFTAITDPVGAKLDSGNITGTSDVLPVEGQLKLIRALMPDATKIGILHTTSETNSDATLALYKELAPNYGFEIIDKGISTGADLPMALDALLPQVDCTTNLTDNTVVSYLAVLLEKSEEYGKPVFGSEIEQVINGCVASEGIEYTELGRQTGRMAARVLRGESAEDIPYETISNSYLYVNPDALAAYGLTVPAELSERAIDVTAE